MQRGGGGSETETTLFVLETDAKLDALRRMRGEVRGLGEDAERMGAKAGAGFGKFNDAEKRAAAGAAGMAGPAGAGGVGVGRAAAQTQARDAAALTAEVNRAIGAYIRKADVVDKTSAQAVAAYRREGDALAANLARLDATERELNAIGAAAQKLERQAGALQIAPTVQPRAPQGTAFRGSIQGASGEEYGRLSPRVLTAANALTVFSLAATNANGSAQAMIVSMGSMATTIAMVSNSARIAAGAAGIGAIVVVLGVVNELVDRFISKAPQAAAAMEKISVARHAAQAHQYVQQIDAQLEALNKQLESNDLVVRAQASAQIVALFEVRSKAVQQAHQMAVDERKQTLDEQRRKHEQELDKERQHREAMARETIASQERIIASRTNVVAMQANRPGALDASAQAEELIRARAETMRRLRELDRNELLTEQQKQAEKAAIEEEGQQALFNIRSKWAKQSADDDMKKREEAKRAQLAIARTAASEMIRSQDSLGKALKRAALEPIITWLEGTAAQEFIAAAKHFAALDFMGGARHAAVAALAIAAGRRLAAMAGTGGGGSAGGSGAGGGAGTFTPSPAGGAGGGTTINLYTRNPYGEEEIAETLHYTNRAEILKKPPMQIPPTTGFRRERAA